MVLRIIFSMCNYNFAADSTSNNKVYSKQLLHQDN